MISIEFGGLGVQRLDAEAGGHRVQRVPRGERSGRVHSSTVTVAAMGGVVTGPSRWERRGPTDFELTWFGGTIGAGGQNRNKTECAARLRHLPTGTVRTAQTRSRENSRKLAGAAMTQELDRQAALERTGAANAGRRAQVGTGERSDKRRTWRMQEGRVHDHATGRSADAATVMKGRFDLLW